MIADLDKFERLIYLKHNHNLHFFECLRLFASFEEVPDGTKEESMKKIWNEIVEQRKEITKLSMELDDHVGTNNLVTGFHAHMTK